MVLGDGEADFGIDLKPPIFVHEDNIWWFEGILVRKQYLSMIQPLVKLCSFRPLKGEMPGVEIIRQRTCFQIFQLLVVKFLDLSQDPLIADIGRLHPKMFIIFSAAFEVLFKSSVM